MGDWCYVLISLMMVLRCRSVLADVRRGVCYVGGRLVFGLLLLLLLCKDKNQKFLPLMNEGLGGFV